MTEKVDKPHPPDVDWSLFIDGKIPAQPPKLKALFITLDTEYQTNVTANSNQCLSYQYTIYDLFEGKYKSGIFYPDINQEERYTLGEFTRKVLKAVEIPISLLHEYRIIYIAHYFAAEWAMFANRHDLYMKFEFIRKTMTTTNRPLKTTMIDENGHEVNLWVDVRDTMLLLPEGYKSLEKASSFIEGYEKIKIEDHDKSNMYQFLQDDPELFEQYAIRDAEVTLKLFIKLQYLLNRINNTTEKLFATLASATTNDYINFSKATFGKDIHKMQFDRLHTLYTKYESIASRGYLGGLNSSYYIGVSEGYTFLDIDFKNAYPTSMNLLKVADFGEPVAKPKKRKKNVLNLEDLDND